MQLDYSLSYSAQDLFCFEKNQRTIGFVTFEQEICSHAQNTWLFLMDEMCKIVTLHQNHNMFSIVPPLS